MTGQAERDEAARKGVREALARLAAPAVSQIAYLREIGVGDCADELAQDLFEYRLMAPGLVYRGAMTADQANAIAELDQVLREMSGRENAALWATEALLNAEQWQQVRELAAECLFRFGAFPAEEE